MRLPLRRRARGGDAPAYRVVEVLGADADLGGAVEAAAGRIAERRERERLAAASGGRRGLLGLALLGGAAAGAWAGARALLARADDGRLDELPRPLARAADALREGREALREGLGAARIAEAEAARELEADYRARTGRAAPPPDALPAGEPPDGAAS